jgi:hypothetical protein
MLQTVDMFLSASILVLQVTFLKQIVLIMLAPLPAFLNLVFETAWMMCFSPHLPFLPQLPAFEDQNGNG